MYACFTRPLKPGLEQVCFQLLVPYPLQPMLSTHYGTGAAKQLKLHQAGNLQLTCGCMYSMLGLCVDYIHTTAPTHTYTNTT
jgi:hypothetical protein